jgi:TPP-dependent pyruvate/acetoin dehydrogenase alpha subunit
MSAAELAKYDALSKEDLLKSYTMMQLCRQFENACNQAYMQVRASPPVTPIKKVLSSFT